jgi:hypothetical protein
MFFGSARQAFLGFLSRLTPQTIFLALAIILGAKLDLKQPSYTVQGFINVLLPLLCFAMCIGAAIASITLFAEQAVASDPRYDRFAVWVKKKFSLPWYKNICVLIRGIWRYNKRMLLQVMLVVAVTELGFLATVVVAVQTAMASPLLRAHG